MRRGGALIALMAAICLVCVPAGCAPKQKTPLRVFYAGSLIIPFDSIEKAYEAKHADIDLQMEGHGSIQVIRHVTDIHDLIDVAVTADYALIPMLMYHAQVPETGQPYASWYVKFATNRLALAFRPESRFAQEISSSNWYEILSKSDVKVGLSDPRFDAVGYRALMALQLAEQEYGQPSLFEDIIGNAFTLPVRARQQDGRISIHVPEIVETKKDSNLVMRAYSIQLINLLEAGSLDYAFEYESVVRQHGLQLLTLPDGINLGSEQFATQYKKVQVQLDFQRFAQVQPVFEGEVIGYGVTIPTNAPQPKLAEAFVAFLIGPEGQRILRDNQQPTLAPPLADNLAALPQALQPLCVALP